MALDLNKMIMSAKRQILTGLGWVCIASGGKNKFASDLYLMWPLPQRHASNLPGRV